MKHKAGIEKALLVNLKKYITAGGDINQPDMFGRDMFLEAISAKYYTIASYMLNNKLEITQWNGMYFEPYLLMKLNSKVMMEAYTNHPKYLDFSEMDINKAFQMHFMSYYQNGIEEDYSPLQNIIAAFNINVNTLVSSDNEPLIFELIYLDSSGLIKLLLDNGLDMSTVTKDGLTLAQYAENASFNDLFPYYGGVELRQEIYNLLNN
jgi:hypothetical protein